MRWTAIFVVSISLCAVGCDRSKSEGPSADTQVEEKARTDTTSPESDGDSSSGSDDRDWEQVVREKVAEGTSSDGRDAGAPCTFFPDSCGDDESCFSTATGERKCREYDDGARAGDQCESADACGEGQQCVGGSPGRCRDICNPDDLERWGCDARETCVRVRNRNGELFEWGVCRRKGDECEPWPEDDCPDGEACIRTPAGYDCHRVDSDARNGDSCRSPVDCRADQVCVEIESGRRCRPKCGPLYPCQRGRCAEVTDRPFGYCTDESSGSGSEAGGNSSGR